MMRTRTTWMCSTALCAVWLLAMGGEPRRVIDTTELPCAVGSAELADAAARLAAIDRQIRNLKPADGHVAANDALLALASHRCMGLSRVDPARLRAEAAPALVDFWNNGGREWIETHLAMATRPRLRFPPAMRKVVAVETRASHPASALLCPLADAGCGRETSGWWQRAENFFRANARPVSRIGRMTGPLGTVPPPTGEECADDARAAPEPERFAVWQRCSGESRFLGFAMPLGHVRAPATGWLLVHGRRGHYSYCDEVRMYSLATGAAYVSQSCSLLMLLIAGDGTPARNRQVVRGSVPVDNLRELAWMLALRGEIIEDFVSRDTFDVPAGIRLVRGSDNPFLSGPPRKSMLVSSDQTTLAWALTDAEGKPLLDGTLRWPEDYLDGPNDHAVELLRIAEAGLTPGCPREIPPDRIEPGAARPAVSALDANTAELTQARRDLIVDLQLAARGECRSGR